MERSIRVRIILLITIAFVILTVAVYIIGKNQLVRVIDSNQSEMYRDKIDAVYSLIDRKNERLQKTGMEVIYRDDFQQQTLKELKTLFYGDSVAMVPLIVLDSLLNVLIHPELELGDKCRIPHEKECAPEGELLFRDGSGEEQWVIYLKYAPWKWIIIYQMPISMKYAPVREFLQTIAPVIILITIAVLTLLSLLVSRIMKPVVSLTYASEEISRGNIDTEIEVGGLGEIAVLTENFRAMRDSVKEQMDALRKSEENLRITLDSITDGMVATDQDGAIVRMNHAAELITGWSYDAAQGNQLGLVFNVKNESGEAIDDVLELLRNQGSVTGKNSYVVLVDRRGNEHQISDNGAPIRNSEEMIVGMVVVFRDITHENALKAQLQQSQKMDAVGQLAGGVAHDFNNMLAGIIGSTELLGDFVTEDGEALVDVISRSAESAASLTKKLLDFSRKGRVESKPCSVHTAITEAVSILNRSINKNIEIKQSLKASNATVIGDFSQLQSMFINLGINAGHAMDKLGGTLEISTDMIRVDQLYCDSVSFDIKPGTFIEVSIRDSGYGISDKNLEKIFDPFFTTKKQGKGTGLGLAAVYATVIQHKGTISVYSEVGKGTKFTILLPLAASEAITVERRKTYNTGSGLILVVDDEEVIRVVARKMLEKMGYQVIEAVNGKEAVKLFEGNKDKINLVILDIIMPEMDGRACFHELKKIDPDVKVIAASGFRRDTDIDELKRAGLYGFIHKPFHISELSEIVTQTIESE